MSRGVVLWPDAATLGRIETLWESLHVEGLPSMVGYTHGHHRPHLSLLVADDLKPAEVLAAIDPIPRRPLPLVVNSVGIFPGGVLHLPCVVGQELLEEHARVHRSVGALVQNPWTYYEPGVWTPHMTLSYGLHHPQAGDALRIVLKHLPFEGWFTDGGVEDGATGERWLSAGSGPERL